MPLFKAKLFGRRKEIGNPNNKGPSTLSLSSPQSDLKPSSVPSTSKAVPAPSRPKTCPTPSSSESSPKPSVSEPCPMQSTPEPSPVQSKFEPCPKESHANPPPNVSPCGGTDTSNDHPIVDDEKWIEGDMEIISADNVRLRAPSSYLLAASPVLRDASTLVTTNTHRVTFVDPDFETAYVLRVVLTLVKQGHIDYKDASDGDNGKLSYEFAKVYEFLRKWDCEMLLHLLRLNMLWDLDKVHDIPRTALIAALANETDLFLHILEVYWDKSWSSAKKEGQNNGQLSKVEGDPSMDIWNPLGWSLDFVTHCPPKYAWALIRAARAAPFVGHQSRHHNKVCENMRLAGIITEKP